MTPQEIARDIVIDHLSDGVEFLTVHEHWQTIDVPEDELREIHSMVNTELLLLIGKISL